MKWNCSLRVVILAALFMFAADRTFAYPTVTLAPEKSVVSLGDSAFVRVNVDMSGGADLLGEYSLGVTWDPAVLVFQRAAGGESEGFRELLSNETKTSSGTLSITYLNTTGFGGMVNVARIVFIVRGAYGAKTDVAPVVMSLSAALTFGDLSAAVTLQPARITVDSPPMFVTTSLPDASQGRGYAATLIVSDPDEGDAHTFDLLAAPGWMTIDGETGTLGGTPEANDAGTNIPVTVRVRDSCGLADTLRTSVNVSANYLSVIEPKSGASWSVGVENRIRWTYSGVTDVKIELSVDGGASWEVIAERIHASDGSYFWKVPDRKSDRCLIRLSDAANAAVSAVSGIFTIVQPGIRVELVNPVTEAVQNASITFAVQVSCDAGVDSVKLYWDITGRRVFDRRLVMKTTDGLNFSATLGEGMFTADGIEYYVEVSDKTGMMVRIPAEGAFYSVSASVTDVVSDVPVHAGTAQTAYRMISIPFVLSATGITEQLNGRLPKGNQGTDWRLFRFSPGADQPQEYPDIEGFAPGKAFWLIALNDYTMKAPPGTTVTTEDRFKLELKPGWNDIANPWTFPVSWADIDNPSNAVLDGLFSYEDSWLLPDAGLTMEPWKGYSVRNMMNVPIIIFLNPKPAAASTKKNTDSLGFEWHLDITARAGLAKDSGNIMGARKDASNGWDRYDHVEPPAIGDYVSVSFPHRDWKDFPCDYTVDVRPPREELVWDFTLRTNIKRKTFRVAIEGVHNLPAGYRLSVMDVDKGYASIPNGETFSFVSGGGFTERHFRAVVRGGGESGGSPTKPERYVTAVSFPNPFNLSATIRYTISLPGNVVITIYNSVGQTVDVRDVGFIGEGVHDYMFNASRFTSGLFFYRIRTPYSLAIGKILCVK